MNHHSKNPKVTQEINHHYGFTSITLGSPGDGGSLIASFMQGLKVLALAKTDRHKEFLDERLLENTVRESSSDPKFFGYMARSDIIERLGLAPDKIDNIEIVKPGTEESLLFLDEEPALPTSRTKVGADNSNSGDTKTATAAPKNESRKCRRNISTMSSLEDLRSCQRQAMLRVWQPNWQLLWAAHESKSVLQSHFFLV